MTTLALLRLVMTYVFIIFTSTKYSAEHFAKSTFALSLAGPCNTAARTSDEFKQVVWYQINTWGYHSKQDG